MNPSLVEIVVWTDASHATLAGQVLEAMRDIVQPISIGGGTEAPIQDLARQFDASYDDDLRRLLIDHPPQYLLLLTDQGLAAEDIQAATQNDVSILTLYPLNFLRDALRPCHDLSHPIPAFEQGMGWTRAADPFEALGTIRHLRITSVGPDQGPSLAGRLLEAWRLALKLMPIPTQIDAALVGRMDHVPDDLQKYTGHLSLHARHANQATVSMILSDQTPRANRQLLIFGEEGQLIISDDAYQLYDATGTLLDHYGDPHAEPSSLADLIVHAWRHLLKQPPGMEHVVGSPEKQSHLFACVTACQVSAKTGEPENPAKLLQLNV